MSFTEQQINDYFTEHEASLAVNGIHKNLGNSHQVRHILLQINKDATDADWEKLRHDAQTLLDQWVAGGATEESFATLAVEKSDDPGSCNSGGLYQGLTDSTSFLKPFKDWYLDESRQVGDYGLVKTTAGYHIMYYSGEEPIWYYYCREMMVSDEMEKIEKAAMEKQEATIYYDKILLGEVKLTEEK
jgi:parvulin-like peptidyl-prolyl isomerase